MYLKYEQVAISNAVKTVADLNPPAKATHCQIQADLAGPIRFTMDATTAPTTTSGMLLLVTEPPTTYLIEDLKRIKFIRNGATDSALNVHYFGGRDV